MPERRVLIWPCDENGLAALPIASAGDGTVPSSAYEDQILSESVRGRSKGAHVPHYPDSDFDNAGKIVVIGWTHVPRSEGTMTTTIAVAAGAILIPHAYKNDRSPSRTNQSHKQGIEPTIESDHDMISWAIQCLSKQFRCLGTKSACGECSSCATYKSLQILHIISHNDPNTKGNIEPKEKLKKHRHQIILYNPKEASEWHTRQSRHKQQRSSVYRNDSWERTLLLVGESFNVFQNLSVSMLYLKQQKIANLTYSLIVEGERSKSTKNDSCHNCRCFTSQESDKRFETRTTKSSSFSIWNESLLLSHYNSADMHYIKQCDTCYSKCTGNTMFKRKNARSRMTGYRTIQLASKIGAKVPLVSLIKLLSIQRAGSDDSLEPHGQWVMKSKFYCRVAYTALFVDAVLGLLIGILCMTCHTSIIDAVTNSWKQCHDSFWENGLAWLQSNPAGVKMNMSLTKQIGTGVRWLLHCHAQVLSHLFPTSTMATVLLQTAGALTIVFGSRFFFALAFDFSRVAIVHIHLLSSLFSACQRLESSTLSSLWLLFRGKKRNILRLRSDHLQYDHMQLLLGMLLFSVGLFLFTTILVHHWFFAVVGFISELILSGMWLGYIGVESIFYIEKVLFDRQSGCCTDSNLIGMQVKLHALSLNADNARRLDNPYVNTFFDGSNPIQMDAEGSVVAAITPCVSVKSACVALSKLSFPSTSNSSIIIKAFLSFFTSRLMRITTFLSSLIFASPCSVAFSCMDITRSLQQSYNDWIMTQ